MDIGLKISYEDNHIIACIKPPGILSQKDRTEDTDMLELVREYLRMKYNKPGNVFVGLVHRLDRPVGGVMIFAKTSKAASRISEQIRTRSFNKKYMAVVYGKPVHTSGKYVDYLLKDEKTNTVKVVSDNIPGAKQAILEYEVVKTVKNENGSYSLISIDLHTGRPHQIRVQFASRNTPLLGDGRYGKDKNADIALWSYSINMEHPVKHERMEIKEKPPEKWPWNIF